MNPELIRQVWARARGICEYCHLPASLFLAPFQIDHIVARQHEGATELSNLALACLRCNRFKGPNIAGFDPHTREIVRLFNPRRDSWREHFAWKGPRLVPVTTVGRVTIQVLHMNDPEVVALRTGLLEEGVWTG